MNHAKITAMETRIVFMGSPNFALPALQILSNHYQLAGVVTQPDRPAGRGRKLVPPPVKQLAIQLDIPFIQPDRLRDPEPMSQLERWQPDVIVVAAFGQILRQNVLDLPVFGCINIHASLLPRWRGAAPIQAAIRAGDRQTGITIMRMDRGVDTGPILSQLALDIDPQDTAQSLSARLAVLGADLLRDTLPGYLGGEVQPVEQDSSQMSLAPMLRKEDSLLDFNQPAAVLERQVRAFQPWPGTSMSWQEQPLKIHQAHVELLNLGEPGERRIINGLPAVCTPQGVLILDEVQPAGRKTMPGTVFLQGARNWQG